MTDEQALKIARAIRFISHGETEPAGLEMLAMSINGEGDHGDLCSAVSNVADALNRIAAAIEGSRTH